MADGPKSVPKQDVGIGSASVQGIAEGVADAASKLTNVALGKSENPGLSSVDVNMRLSWVYQTKRCYAVLVHLVCLRGGWMAHFQKCLYHPL